MLSCLNAEIESTIQGSLNSHRAVYIASLVSEESFPCMQLADRGGGRRRPGQVSGGGMPSKEGGDATSVSVAAGAAGAALAATIGRLPIAEGDE